MKFLKRYFNNTKIEKRALRQLNSTVDYLVKKQSFHLRAMDSSHSLIEPPSMDSSTVIVSLTTYSRRIHDVYLVIESLGYQTIRANKIVLWLDEDEFSLDTIPALLHKQIARGLEVRFCRNIKSYKKLIPALKSFPDSDIITVDDDFLYPHDLIELLIKEKHCHPSSIIGCRAHTIKHKDGKVLPYKEWNYESSYHENGIHTFLTTGAGTLFPASVIGSEFCNEDDFMSICPSADDVWINFMCIKHRINRIKVRDDRPFTSRFFLLEEHQDMALSGKNVHQNQNNEQVKRIIEKYDIIL